MEEDKNKPTFAIALQYDGDGAPEVVARGYHEIAEEILELAKEANEPLHQDNELAALLEDLDLGDQVPQALYRVVAEVLVFAYRLSGKHKAFMDKL